MAENDKQADKRDELAEMDTQMDGRLDEARKIMDENDKQIEKMNKEMFKQRILKQAAANQKIILGNSGESLGSGTGASMDLGDAEKIGEGQKAKIIAEKNEEEEKHDNEEEKKEEAKKEEAKHDGPKPFSRRPRDLAENREKEIAEIETKIKDIENKLRNKKGYYELKNAVKMLSLSLEKKYLEEMERIALEKELEETKKELLEVEDLDKMLLEYKRLKRETVILDEKIRSWGASIA